MARQAIVIVEPLQAGDPESDEIIRSLNVELEPFNVQAVPDREGAWRIWFASDETAGGDPWAMVRAKLDEVHPNWWDHLAVLVP